LKLHPGLLDKILMGTPEILLNAVTYRIITLGCKEFRDGCYYGLTYPIFFTLSDALLLLSFY